MTERESFNIAESKLKIFARDNWTCCFCNHSIYKYGTPQIAHGISKSKANLKKWGAEIIHSDFNLYSACSLACNAGLAVGKANEANRAEEIKRGIE